MAKITKKTVQGRPSATPIVDLPETSNRAPSMNDHETLIFGKGTIIWIGIGVGLMFLGMILMAGGSMPNPDVWDDELIYSFRRITLAPIVILTGLGVITYAILKK
jgi:hypothetical protein